MSEKENDISIWEESVKRGNVKPDKKDDRDFRFSDSLAKLPKAMVDTTNLPQNHDLRHLNNQIEDQGHVGSCVAQACVNAYEILLEKSNQFYDLSRLFVYYIAREEWPALCCKDNGAWLRDGIKEVYRKGVPPETTWKYSEGMVNFKPSEAAYTEALDTKVNRYERIFGFGGFNEDKNIVAIDEVKIALLRGFPVPISMYLTHDFYSLGNNLETQNYRGRFSGSSVGGHAMCIVGYDDHLGGFIVENSWSSRWGANGYFLLKYDVAFKDIMDAWVVTAFKDVYFDDEFNYERPFENYANKEFNIYRDDVGGVGGFGEMTCNVTGTNNPLKYEWHLDSFSLTDTILQNTDSKTCKIRVGTVPNSYGGYVIVKDHKWNFVVQVFTVNLLPGSNPIRNYVKRLYSLILNRQAEEAGVVYWTNQLMSGALTGRGIIRSFFVQPEWTTKNYPAEEVIKIIYRTMLGREPDPSGFAFWVNVYKKTNGSTTEITKGFSESIEFRNICSDAGISPF